jgi:hypothetical protein
MNVEAVVDTGGEYGVMLPKRLAAEMGFRPDGPPRRCKGAAGLVEVIPAGRADVEIAGVKLVGVPVRIGPTDWVMLGDECLTRIGGIAFDWAGKRFGAVARGGASAPAPGWVALPLFPSAHEGASDPELLTIRIRLPFLRATLEGRSVLAMLDTGDMGEVGIPGLAPEPADKELSSWFGKSTPAYRSRRTMSLVIGDLPAFQVRPTWMGKDADPAPADVVVGLEVLGRQPVWFDFDAAAVRFWRADPAAAPPATGN